MLLEIGTASLHVSICAMSIAAMFLVCVAGSLHIRIGRPGVRRTDCRLNHRNARQDSCGTGVFGGRLVSEDRLEC